MKVKTISPDLCLKKPLSQLSKSFLLLHRSRPVIGRRRSFICWLDERIMAKFKFLTKFPSFWYQIVHIFLFSTIFRHCVYCMLLKSPFIMHCCSEVNWRENDVAMTICLNLVLNRVAMTKEERRHVEAIQTRSGYHWLSCSGLQI